MRFRTAVKLAKGLRFIQRMNGNTIFDVVKYNPENIDQEDVYADDWVIPEQKRISYFDKSGRTSVHAKNMNFFATSMSKAE